MEDPWRRALGMATSSTAAAQGFEPVWRVSKSHHFNRCPDHLCPPEDVGGLPGYEHFLKAIGDKAHPEHEDLTEWAGGSFDPHVPDAYELRFDVFKLAKKWKPKKR